jgi:hypothetical protein
MAKEMNMLLLKHGRVKVRIYGLLPLVSGEYTNGYSIWGYWRKVVEG